MTDVVVLRCLSELTGKIESIACEALQGAALAHCFTSLDLVLLVETEGWVVPCLAPHHKGLLTTEVKQGTSHSLLAGPTPARL